MIPKVSSLLNTCREHIARTNTSISIVSSTMFVHVSLKIYLSLTILGPVARAPTSWQLINFSRFLEKSNSKKFWSFGVRFQVRYQ